MGAVIGKVALSILSDEKGQKVLAWVVIALVSPLVICVVLLCSFLSSTTQHNQAVVDFVFNGGALSSTMDSEFADHIETLRSGMNVLDVAISVVSALVVGTELDGARVKSIFYTLYFPKEDASLTTDIAAIFVDCFVEYETVEEQVADGTDPDTGETKYKTVEVTIAKVLGLDTIYANLSAAGFDLSEDDKGNADTIYEQIAYGYSGDYYGELVGVGTSPILDTSAFVDGTTKNNMDLAIYALRAWEDGWGYVLGTYGQVLTESLLQSKAAQLPVGVGDKIDYIRETWLGNRTADCVGLIKSYGWYDPDSGAITYGTNGMADYSADSMYNAATVKGSISTMPEVVGLAVWTSGHIGIYVGNGKVVEAMGTSYGVVQTNLADKNWTAWLQVPGITYLETETE